MDKFFKGLQKAGDATIGKLYDLFNVTPEEEAQGKKAKGLEKVGQKVGDFFEPTEDVRARDVVREMPEAFAEVLGRPILRSFAVLGEKVSKLDPRAEYQAETPYERDLLGLDKDEKASFASIAKESTLRDKDAKTIPGLDPALGGFIAMTDVFTGGRGKQIFKGLSLGAKELKALKGLNKVDDVIKVLVKGGMKAEDAMDVAEDIAKATKTDDVTKIIRNKVEVPKTPKNSTTKAVASEAGDVSRATEKAEDYVYHTTSPDNFNKISDQGLKPSKGQYGDGVYFAPDEARTAGYGSPEGLMTRVNRKNLPDDFQEWPGEQGWTNRTIDPEIIEYKASDGTWKPLKENTAKSIGEILEGRKGGGEPPVSRATPEDAPLKPKKDERRFITRTKALAPEASDLLDGKKGTRSTEELVAKADELIKSNPDEAENIARTDTSDFGVAVASRLIDSRVKEAQKATNLATKNQLWEGVADVANDAAKNLTEHGRAIQAATILGKMTPEGMVRFAAGTIQRHNRTVDGLQSPVNKTIGNLFGTKMGKQLKKVPELTAEQAKDITKQMEDILKIADETERAMAFQKLDDTIKSMIPSSLYKKIVTLWKAGLLTGIKTSGLNIASNTAHNVTEVLKDVPSAMVDKVVSLFTGKRTMGVTTKGVGEGLKEGVAKGWRYFKTGFDERDIGSKLDYNKVNFGNSKMAKALQRYEETVFRSLGSQDQPFYYGAKTRSLYSQAIAKAKNAGKKGKEAKEFIEELVQNPTDEMLKFAVLDAETAVFQNKTVLGQGARAIQNLPGGEIVLPFGKTPSAVATQIINYSPIGIVKTLATNIGKGKFDQRTFSQGLGRGLTGTGIMYLGMKMLDNDMVTTAYPTSEKERELWELEGRQSNSIKIGGKWRNAGVLGPAGLLLIIGGHVQEGINETGSWAGGLAQGGAGFGSTLTDQSFLRGINQTIEAVNDPNRSFNGWASSLAGSVVPTLISDIARSTDKYERRTASPMERIKSRIPGVRQGLEPKVDAFGKPVETANFFTTMFDATRPTQPTADKNDPVVKEFKRLQEEGYLVTPTQLGPNKGYESLTPEQNTLLWKMAGQVGKQEIESLMQSRTWNRLDDEQKANEIDDVIGDVKLEARARIVAKAVEGLSEKEKNKKLAEMKEDKLLTRSVYDLYLSLTR